MLLKIKNFQSIEYCELEIPEGEFTIVVGPSNTGKSAIIRALECVLYNKSDGDQVRNGANSCEIEIIFRDNTKILWSRTRTGGAKYLVNGESFSAIGKTVPPILIEKGFYELITKDKKINVQIAPQFDNIFLLNKTGGSTTEIISNLGNLDRIVKSNKMCEADLRNFKNKLTFKQEDLKLTSEKIKKYNGLDEQRNKVDKLKDNLLEIKNLKNKLEVIIKLKEDYNHFNKILSILSPLEKIVIPLLDIDPHKLLNIKEIYLKYIRRIQLITIYKNIPKKEIEFDLEDQHKKYTTMVSINKKFEKLESKRIYYEKIPNILPKLENIDLEKLKIIKELYSKMLSYVENIKKLNKRFKETEEKLESLNKEKENIYFTMKVCPVCDRLF